MVHQDDVDLSGSLECPRRARPAERTCLAAKRAREADGPKKGSGAIRACDKLPGGRARIEDETVIRKTKGADKLFKGRHFEREIIVLCVRWYPCYKLRRLCRSKPMSQRYGPCCLRTTRGIPIVSATTAITSTPAAAMKPLA